MVRIIFVHPDGAETEVEAHSNDSIMQTALAHGIKGIVTECNGAAACARCHVVFEQSILPALAAMQEHEEDMLDFAAAARQNGSRLSCQVPVSDALNGQRIRISEAQ